MINSPKLPPKEGYVERKDKRGNPIYVATGQENQRQQREIKDKAFLLALLGDCVDYEQATEQLRRAIQILAVNVTEEQAMEIATVYPKYVIGKNYGVGDYFTEGFNAVGDPQLYKVLQKHTSQADWIPSETPSLYKPIGITEKGCVEWSPPTGAHDTYAKGDIVWYKGILYISTVDNNAYAPGVVEGQWEMHEE